MPRSLSADALFEAGLSPSRSQQFVRQSGARFLLSSCDPQDVDITKQLGSLLVSRRRFGCATVYEVSPPAKADGPLAELPTDAALRAPRRQ